MQIVSGFRVLFITEFAYVQLKARGGIFDLLSIAKRNLKTRTHPIVSTNQPQTSLRTMFMCVDAKSFFIVI